MVAATLTVRKRSGLVVDFDHTKIVRAISRAFMEYLELVRSDRTIDEYKYVISSLADGVANVVHARRANGTPIGIEAIQDTVEAQLLAQGHLDIARLYIHYRAAHKKVRASRLTPDNKGVMDYAFSAKYANFISTAKRREIYLETTTRVRKMHLDRFPELAPEINWAFDMVDKRLVLPSMRSMQFGGQATLVNNARIYNCSASACNRLRFFQEAFFLLLSGVGVGYSVQSFHVDMLPELTLIIDHTNVVHHTITDTIEGWADALGRLIHSYSKGYHIEFNYSQIRPLGSIIKTAGGRAPGHLPLKNSLEAIRGVLDKALGRKLRPIECHDIVCHAADAVMAGGSRESACIAIFDIDDLEMLNAKTGNWYPTAKQRARANNSAVVFRNEASWSMFKKIFKRTKEWGEPGVYFSDDPEIIPNPCVEIAMRPLYVVADQADADRLQRLYRIEVAPGDKFYGWQFCNLTEQNAAAFKTPDDFYLAAKAASIIGTLQAAYTDFPYLGWASQEITRREALLGVSMTGMMDSPQIALDPEIQRKAAQIVIETNRWMAEKLGINPASRATCVKPSGTTSLVLGCIGSGIHPHHARRYLRRVKAPKTNPIFQFFKTINPHMVEKYEDHSDLVVFPIQAPDNAILNEDLTALQFLEKVLSTQVNWVEAGRGRPETAPAACHNVSNTITVKPHEWDEVAQFLWDNRQHFTGVSLLSHTGDKDYKNAPREAITTEEDEVKWNSLIAKYTPVDYLKHHEDEDNTTFGAEPACAGGHCNA